MTTDLVPFDLGEFGQLRYHLNPAGEPRFCCKDVGQALDYANMSITDLFSHVPEEWKGLVPIQTPGGTQQMLAVSEQGLYFFLGRSDKPKALPYQMKVAGEIMPSIRRHGAYLTPAKVDELIANPDLVIRLASEVKAERARTAELAARIEADAPKVEFAEAIIAGEGDIEVGELAVLVKMGRNKLFRLLREGGWLCKQPGPRWNMPTGKALGLLVETERPRVDRNENPVYGRGGKQEIDKMAMVTPAGQKFFINLFGKK
jgi:anti-repressor protein